MPSCRTAKCHGTLSQSPRLFCQIIKANAETLNNAIDPQRDFNYDYFGFKTLERSYLLKVNKKIVERPQYMLMRVAIGIHKTDIEAALER